MNKENASKNLDFDIVIACTYDDRLLRYLTTMREHYDGHCKLFLLDQHNTAPTNIGELFDIDATIIYERWNRTNKWLLLRNYCLSHRPEFVLFTDVYDVVFQEDPRKYFIDRNNIYVASEGVVTEKPNVRLDSSPWMDELLSVQSINSGVIGGAWYPISIIANCIGNNIFNSPTNKFELRHLFPIMSSFLVADEIIHTVDNKYNDSGCIINNQFCDKISKKPFCVVHSNGDINDFFSNTFRLSNYLGKKEKLKFDHKIDFPKDLLSWSRVGVIRQDHYCTCSYKEDSFDVVIDIGGRDGDTCIPAAVNSPKARVFSYEACRDVYKKLVENTESVNNIQAFNIALGDGHGVFEGIGRVYKTPVKDGQIAVPSVRFHDICEQNHIDPSIDDVLVIIDCEGGEKFLIGDNKSENLLRQCKHIAMEIHFQCLNDFRDMPQWHVYDNWIRKTFRFTHSFLYHRSRKSKGNGVYVLQRI